MMQNILMKIQIIHYTDKKKTFFLKEEFGPIYNNVTCLVITEELGEHVSVVNGYKAG
jgi:hypothetical protein